MNDLFWVIVAVIVQSLMILMSVWLGYCIGKPGDQPSIFTKISKPALYEDAPGGSFEDHAPGGKYDQIETAESEANNRIQTI